MESIESMVMRIVAEQLGLARDQVRPDSSFVDLGGDSLDQVEIIMALEDEFETEIDDTDAEKIQTVQQAINYVTTKSNG